MIPLNAARSRSGEISTTRQSRGKNRDKTQTTWPNGHSPPGRTWVRWSKIRYSCFRPKAGGTQSRTSRCTIRPTRFFDASTWSAIPSAARTPCSIGFSVSVPMNDSRRASTTITTSPERSPSYSFVKSRSRRAEAFPMIRRASSPATDSPTPHKTLAAPDLRGGSTSTISTRSRAGPSLRTRRWTSTGWPTSARSRERDRTATTRGRTGGNNEPSARTMIGGRARSTSCQLRSASPARSSPSAAAARPLAKGVRMSRHLRHRDLAEDVREDGGGPHAADPWIWLQDEAMGQGGHRDRLHVVWRHEVAARHGRASPGGFQEGEGAPRACPDFDLAVGAGARDDVDHVPFDRGIDVDVFDRGLERAHLRRRRHRLDRGIVRPAFPSPLEHFDLLLAARIAYIDLQEEPVDLGLRERVRAFVLDRGLGRDHEERWVEAERLALEGRLSLLHRFEERALRLRRRAVDLVRQEDVREDRAAPQHEVAGLPIEHVRPSNVRGEQIRSELHAPEREAKTRGKGFRDQRLGEPRDVLDEQVAVAEDRPQHPFEDRSLADDDRLDRVEEIPADVSDCRDVHRHASIRSRTP